MMSISRISGLVVEYIVAIDVTRIRFPADALFTGVYILLWTMMGGWWTYLYFKSGRLHSAWLLWLCQFTGPPSLILFSEPRSMPHYTN